MPGWSYYKTIGIPPLSVKLLQFEKKRRKETQNIIFYWEGGMKIDLKDMRSGN